MKIRYSNNLKELRKKIDKYKSKSTDDIKKLLSVRKKMQKKETMKSKISPISKLKDWKYKGGKIYHKSNQFFSVEGVTVKNAQREVAKWDQLIFNQPHGGVLAFLVRETKKNGIEFYVSNDTKLLTKLKADGLYISAYNRNLLLNIYSKKGFKIIGSAHNQREIDLKIKQGCEAIIYSRLFRTNYPYKKGHLGMQKFNIISLRSRKEIIPLGGINEKNLCKMKSVMSSSFACLSAIKKKPAKIINRLF